MEWASRIEIQCLSLRRGAPPKVIPVPGSKSITNRALILAAQCEQEIRLQGALWSEDTQILVTALRRIGIPVEIEQDSQESSNRTFVMRGLGGKFPQGGSLSHPLDIFVGNSGTSTRFLMAFLCHAGGGWYRLDGTPRMRQRPQLGLMQALRHLGYTVVSERDGYLPVMIGAERLVRGGHCEVDSTASSQYASALLLCAERAGWQIDILGDTQAPYIRMTREMVKAFPFGGGVFQIEPDASSGSYFYAANVWVEGYPEQKPISVADWPSSSGWQIDADFPRFLPLPKTLSREKDLGDSIMTAIVVATQAPEPVTFTDLGRLRVQECERVSALKTELTRCGAKVQECGDTLTVYPSQLHGAEIETYNDHRMAMCFAVLGLGVPGMVIKNPACVEKTFPNFFEKLKLLGE